MSKNLRFTLLGLFAIMLTFGFTVRTLAQTGGECNPQLLTYSVTLEGIEYTGVVDQEAKTLDFTVPYGTANYLDMGGALILTGDFTVSPGAWMTHSEDPAILQVSGTTPNDFSDPVAFTVHSKGIEQSCTVEYFVTIEEAENGCNDIESIQFQSFFRDCYKNDIAVDLMFASSPDGLEWFLEVPYGTMLDDIYTTLTFASMDAPEDCDGDDWRVRVRQDAFVDGEARRVVVTAPNNISKKRYELTVTVADPSDHNILGAENEDDLIQTFYFPESNFNGVIDEDVIGVVDQDEQRIDLFVPYNMDPYGAELYSLEDLVACFDFSDYACVYVIGPATTDATLQTTCVTSNDYTEPLHYTVIAQDGTSERYYNVFVEMALPDTDNSISDMTATGLLDCNGMDAETLVLDLEEGAFSIRVPDKDWGEGNPDITVEYVIPALADGIPASGFNLFDEAVSGVVEIVVTAESGDEVTYTLEIDLVDPSTVGELVEFSFEPENNDGLAFGYPAVVEDEDFPFDLTVFVPFDTEVDDLVATFLLEDEYATMTHSEDFQNVMISDNAGNALDYTTPVAFTVFAEDCSTVEYFVTVKHAPERVGVGLGFDFVGTQYDNCGCDWNAPIGNEDVSIASFLGETMTTDTITVPAGTMVDTLFFTVEEGAMVMGDVANIGDSIFYVFGLDIDATITVDVLAPNGIDTWTYEIVVVEDEASDENMLEEFYFTMSHNPTLEMDTIWGAIDELRNRIDVVVPYSTPEGLIVDFVQSPLACVYLNGPVLTDKTSQCSGEAPPVDFSTYQTYTVIAQNGDEAYYNVYVTWLPADTDTFLNGLVANNLDECFGEFVYTELGVYDETDIDIPVKDGADVSAVEVTFSVPEKAVVTIGETVLVHSDTVNGVYYIETVLDLTSPVNITVTAEDPEVDPVVYTVSAVEFDPSSDKMITSYKIGDAVGSIDQVNKVIEVWVPWMTDVRSLKATFTLSDGAKMTHSEDSWVLQKSGVTPNNFETPVAYTVWAEDCSTLEYFVIVRITPDTNTSISQFVIDQDGCFCDEDGDHFRIDNFAKRIYVQIPYADANGVPVSLSSLNVLTIGVADGATVSPGTGTQNFSNGPVTYTVTAPDGVTEVAWEVFVENPPCTGTDILDWSIVGEGQFEWTWTDDDDKDHVYTNPVIDKANHTITVMLVPGTDLTSILADATLECGATICCSAGNCAGNVIDFSGEDQCHTCVVTAQDKSITQDWTICVKMADVVTPVVYTTSVLAMNCSDSVMVHGDKDGGTIYIVDEGTAAHVSHLVNGWSGNTSTLAGLQSWMAMNMAARDLVSAAVTAKKGASASYPYADSTVAIMTEGIYSGLYYAILVDAAGNVSCSSEEAIFIDECVVEVANLCDLRAGSPVYTYVVTGEVLVSYEEGDFKFVQDDNCGIKVIDNLDAWPNTYGVGTGLTNIKGRIDKTGNEYKFYPVCCYSPEKSSTGNTIVPVELTWDGFLANCYTHSRGYESMLVRITDPMLAVDDYDNDVNWELDYLDLTTYDARGNKEWFVEKTFDANYIGTAIPTVPTIYQGIRTNVDWDPVYGLITPRSKTDIIKVEGGILIADPNPVTISNVIPGTCGSKVVTLINQGVGNIEISALYLDDAVGTDEFELMDPEQVPFTLGTWEQVDVTISFCPTNAGDESTTLLAEYGDGKVMEVPINGGTVTIVDFPITYDFDGDEWMMEGWSQQGMSTFKGWGSMGNGIRAAMYGWSFAECSLPAWVMSPGIDMTSAVSPVVTFTVGTWFASHFRLQVSTDFQSTWTDIVSLNNYNAGGNGVQAPFSVDLSDYKGETIFLRWYVPWGNYISFDNIKVIENITDPIFANDPALVDLGGVQIGETATATVTITNAGASVLKIKEVMIQGGPQFTLTDDNTYPVEVEGAGVAFTKNGSGSVTFDITFAPTDLGVLTGKVLVTYGLYSDKVAEIPFMGEGLSCATATEAFVGENWAPGQNIWFSYTAEKFQIVNINTCHPFNTTDPYEYSFDTYMYIYDDCDGNLIAENDDLEWDACPYNRASSGATLAMNEGETVKIFFPWAFSSANDDIGFYMNIEPSYPIDGDVCETAIPLTLPVVNHFGSTAKFADDYDMSPCSPFSNYMDGNDKVYSITLDVEGYLTANILGAYGSVHVLDMCPVEELEKRNCKLFTSGPNGGEATKRIQPGTYYVIISTWSPPQTVDYLLNMSFEELSTGIDDAGLGNSLVVYPNPTQGLFTVSISNAEASDMTLELVNISGQTVYRNEVKSVYSYNEEIDASSFAKGVYYLKVNNGEEVKIEKVVIQ